MPISQRVDIRQKLVDTAARLFYVQGYQATGINQIIDEASVCKASFYNHFRTKEDLLIAWLERSHNEAMAQLRARLAQAHGPREQLRAFFHFQEERLSASGFRGCPLLNSLAEVPDSEKRVRQVMHWHTRAQRQMLEEFVMKAMAGRHITREDAQQTVDDLEVIIHGGVMAARAEGDVKLLRHALTLAERILGIQGNSGLEKGNK